MAGVPGSWLVWAGVSMVGILVAVAFLGRQRKSGPAGPRSQGFLQRLHSENGTATIEFVLVLPVLCFFVMMLIQISLLMVGYQFVQHAAFRAARTAIVWIPQDASQASGEKVNQINAGSDTGKFGKIKLSAQLAVMPVCGEASDSGASDITLKTGVQAYYTASGGTSPHWVDSLLMARLEYATQYTRVKLLQGSDGKGNDASDWVNLPDISGSFTYGPKDPVVVQIEHDMNLTLPYIGKIFEDGTHATTAGTGHFVTIKTRAILVNEGIDPTIHQPNDEGQAQNGSPSPIPRIDPPTQ